MTDARKTVLITGCTPGGIGHALALEFQKQGARVFATARRTEVLEDLRAKGMEVLALDVTSDESVRAAAASLRELTGGKLDVLVNNAGRMYTMAALDADIPHAEAIFNTNVFGPMRTVREFGPMVVAARGKIVNNAANAAHIPMPLHGVYGATKAAVLSFGDSLRLEMKPFGVEVITLLTGGVTTPGYSNERTTDIPTDSLYASVYPKVDKVILDGSSGAMPAEEYARKVVSTVMKPGAPKWFWVGSNSTVVWVLSTLLPRWLQDNIVSGMWGLSSLTPEKK
ncbi:NAD(P)-binding protein [Exidia glandulosa HHB12029]|uniref:NAD(P)-binding protein n=1 Tax=Exidia glandulosa HHB12029 TaxID=1314781 RepID=A0A165L8L3_EXIGL|nr:NAD(P)-binding protein [Exidia glandulosa HHB12029]